MSNFLKADSFKVGPSSRRGSQMNLNDAKNIPTENENKEPKNVNFNMETFARRPSEAVLHDDTKLSIASSKSVTASANKTPTMSKEPSQNNLFNMAVPPPELPAKSPAAPHSNRKKISKPSSTRSSVAKESFNVSAQEDFFVVADAAIEEHLVVIASDNTSSKPKLPFGMPPGASPVILPTKSTVEGNSVTSLNNMKQTSKEPQKETAKTEIKSEDNSPFGKRRLSTVSNFPEPPPVFAAPPEIPAPIVKPSQEPEGFMNNIRRRLSITGSAQKEADLAKSNVTSSSKTPEDSFGRARVSSKDGHHMFEKIRSRSNSAAPKPEEVKLDVKIEVPAATKPADVKSSVFGAKVQTTTAAAQPAVTLPTNAPLKTWGKPAEVKKEIVNSVQSPAKSWVKPDAKATSTAVQDLPLPTLGDFPKPVSAQPTPQDFPKPIEPVVAQEFPKEFPKPVVQDLPKPVILPVVNTNPTSTPSKSWVKPASKEIEVKKDAPPTSFPAVTVPVAITTPLVKQETPTPVVNPAQVLGNITSPAKTWGKSAEIKKEEPKTVGAINTAATTAKSWAKPAEVKKENIPEIKKEIIPEIKKEPAKINATFGNVVQPTPSPAKSWVKPEVKKDVVQPVAASVVTPAVPNAAKTPAVVVAPEIKKEVPKTATTAPTTIADVKKEVVTAVVAPKVELAAKPAEIPAWKIEMEKRKLATSKP